MLHELRFCQPLFVLTVKQGGQSWLQANSNFSANVQHEEVLFNV
jgi:hypothetical protein